MFAKAGLGLIGLSAISVGGVALAKPHLLGMDYMPEWHSLSEDSGYNDTDYGSDKFGNKYGKYLVGSTNKKGSNSQQTNDAWWEWSFRRIDKEKLDKGKFKTLKSESSNSEALKKLCEEAYKKAPNELKNDSDNNTTDTDFKKSDVWKYCSPGKLTTTSEGANTDSYNSNQIGGEDSNKTKLISVKNSANDWFWKIRNEEFWSTNENNNTLSGSTATETSGNKSIFKKEYETNSATTEKNKRQTIKQLCEEAYKLGKNDKTSDNTDANKFCKLETN